MPKSSVRLVFIAITLLDLSSKHTKMSNNATFVGLRLLYVVEEKSGHI